MVARYNQLKLPNVGKIEESPSTMQVNMKLHNLGNIEVGKTVKMMVHAKVVSHSQDQYGHSARLEVSKMSVDNPRGNADRDR